MEAELVTLIGTGATTVVGLMVTDAWEQAKQRLSRLLARGGEPAAVAGELEESRTALVAAAGTPDQEDLTADLTASVRLQLRRLITQNPDAADELRILLDEFTPALRPDPAGTVHNNIGGGTFHSPVLQGQNFTNVTLQAGRSTEDR